MVRVVMVAFGFVVAVAGCSAEPTGTEASLTKEEAVELVGKGDTTDFCLLEGWYGDGTCDPWCPKPDPDCAPTGVSCGGFAGFSCPAGEYCSYDLGAFCGFADAPGVCAPR